jgi:hypothetical protein
MAIINCSKHGRKGCSFVSRPFFEALAGGGPLHFKPEALHLNLFGKDGCDIWVDPQFLIDHNVEANPEHHYVVQDEDRAFEIFSDLVPVCHSCYEHYLDSQGLQHPKHMVRR